MVNENPRTNYINANDHGERRHACTGQPGRSRGPFFPPTELDSGDSEFKLNSHSTQQPIPLSYLASLKAQTAISKTGTGIRTLASGLV